MNVTFFTSKSTTLATGLAAVTLALWSAPVLAADPMDQARALIQPTVHVSVQSHDSIPAIDPHLQAIRLILAKSAPALTAPMQQAQESKAAGADPHQQARDLIQPPRVVSRPALQQPTVADGNTHLVRE